MSSPRVTVVVVCTPEDEGPNGDLMQCVHSVEQQTYDRDLVDTNIVRNVDGSSLTTMRRFGVEHADSELIAFIDVRQVWPPGLLAELVDRLGDSYAYGGTGLDNGEGYGSIFRKDYYLSGEME